MEPGKIGTCQVFSRVGQNCRQFSNAQLLDSGIDDSLKCATTYNVNGALFLNQAGACVEGKCQVCSEYGGGGLHTCNSGRGFKRQRSCTAAGNLRPAADWAWAPSIIGLTPKYTWFTILGTFAAVILILQIIIAIRGKGRSTGDRDSSSRESTRKKAPPPPPGEIETVVMPDSQGDSVEMQEQRQSTKVTVQPQ